MGLLHIGEESFVTEALFIHKALALHRNSGHQHDQDIVKTFYSYYQNYDPFFYQKIVSQPEKTEDIHGNPHPDLEYQCTPTELVMVDILNPPDILLKSISVNEQNNGPEKEVYFLRYWSFTNMADENILYTMPEANTTVTAYFMPREEDLEIVDQEWTPRKILQDGQILILRGDKTYNTIGTRLK